MQKAWLEFTEADIEEVVEHCFLSVCREVAEYGARGEDMAADLRGNMVTAVRLQCETLRRSRMPTAEEMEAVLRNARRRVHQGFSKEAVLRSYRLGGHIIWSFICARAKNNPEAIRQASELAFRYIDHISVAVDEAFSSEKDSLLRSKLQPMQLFIESISNPTAAIETEIERLAKLIGYDSEGPHVAVAISHADSQEVLHPTLSMNLLSELHRSLPAAASAYLSPNVVVVLQATSTANIGRIVSSCFSRVADAPGCKLGVSSPRIGMQGLKNVVHEASRALLVGRIWAPADSLYRSEELAAYDVFKGQDEIANFVRGVVKPFIEFDAERGTQLLQTLMVYYAESMNRKAAAHTLNIHPNTLDYRLRQAEKIASAPINSGDYGFRFQLAARLLPIAGLTVTGRSN